MTPLVKGVLARVSIVLGCWFAALMLAVVDLDSEALTVSDLARAAVSSPVLVWVAVIFVAVQVSDLLREMAHAGAGRLFGGRSPRIALTVNGAETTFSDWPPTRRGMAFTLAAGPAVSLVYASLLATAALRTNPGGLLFNPLAISAFVAALVSLWNLVPVGTHDGAKLLALHRSQTRETHLTNAISSVSSEKA